VKSQGPEPKTNNPKLSDHPESLRQWLSERLSQSDSTIPRQQKRAEHIAEIEALMSSPEVVSVLSNIGNAIRNQRIALREDQNIRVNVGLREEFLALMLSYEPSRLLPVLEVVTRSSQPEPQERLDVRRLISKKILQSSDLRQLHCKPGVILTQAAEARYQRALDIHLLERVFTAIVLLDRLRVEMLCGDSLPLFQTSAPVKSTKDILVSFCKRFLRSEKNILKHLSSLGFCPAYAQSEFDEFPFALSDFDSDLRDGIRLTFLVNKLSRRKGTGRIIDPSLLRIPAISRLQKLHNNGLLLQALLPRGVVVPFDEKSLVDGSRESLVLLLALLCFEFESQFVLSEEAILKEIARIDISAVVREDSADLTGTASEIQLSKYRRLLLCWVRVIAAQSSFDIEDLGSLGSGLALCLLLRHYCPQLVPAEAVEPPPPDANKRSVERKRFVVIQQACQQLHFPALVPSSDSIFSWSHTTLVFFLGFLLAALLRAPSPSDLRPAESCPQMQVAAKPSERVSNSFPDCSIFFVEKNPKTAVTNAAPTAILTAEPLKSLDQPRTAPPQATAQRTLPQSSLPRTVTPESVPESLPLPRPPPPAPVRKGNSEADQDLLKLRAAMQAESQCRSSAEKRVAELESSHAESLRIAEERRQLLEWRLQKEMSEKRSMRQQYETEFSDEIIRSAELALWTEFQREWMGKAVALIQRLVRAKLSRQQRRRQRSSALLLQSQVRGWAVRRRVSLFISAVRSLQSSFLLRQLRHRRSVTEHSSALKIQRSFRRFLFASAWRNLVRCSALVNGTLRAWIARRSFQRQRHSAIALQALARRFITARSLRAKSVAAFSIQRSFKDFQRRKLATSQLCASRIQIRWKEFLLRRALRSSDLQTRKMEAYLRCRAARKIVTLFREVVTRKRELSAAKAMSRWYLSMLPVLRIRKLLRGFRRLQALRRSLRVRRSMPSEALAMFLRVQRANENSLATPHLQLGNLTKEAISILLKGKMISQILRACQTLELSTLYSPVCCQRFIQSTASKILFSLICSCNRTTPHQELLRSLPPCLPLLTSPADAHLWSSLMSRPIRS
jgi:hypothetical protein